MATAIQCPPRSEIERFGRGDLGPIETASVAAHVSSCDNCSRVASSLVGMLPTEALGPAATPPTRRQDLRLGKTLGRYRVLEVLGEGGMGTVYRAHDLQLDRQVALKVLHLPSANDLPGRVTMIQEARAMARLLHPNIVTIFDAGEVDGTAYIAMELLDGTTLAEWLAARPRSLDEVVSAFAKAGCGLIAAHEANIVHRDVKPANILIDRSGRVAVTDFGIARIDGSARPEPSRTQAERRWATQTRGIMGTPAYMSPEQYSSGDVDARSDQFSFAVALYEALFRTPPFPGRTADERHAALLTGTLAPCDAPARARVPPRLYLAIERALSRDPAARFPRMNELVAELVVLQTQPRSRPPTRLPLALGILGALVVTTLLGIALLVGQGDHAADSPASSPGSMARSPPTPREGQLSDPTPSLAALSPSVITTRLHQAGWNVVSSSTIPSLGTTTFVVQSTKTKEAGSVVLYDQLNALSLRAVISGCQVSHSECDSGGSRVLSVHVREDAAASRSLLKRIELQ